MPIFDDVGQLVTAIAFTVVIVAVVCLLLHWVIRSAVNAALRRHFLWVESYKAIPIASGSAMHDLPRGWDGQR